MKELHRIQRLQSLNDNALRDYKDRPDKKDFYERALKLEASYQKSIELLTKKLYI